MKSEKKRMLCAIAVSYIVFMAGWYLRETYIDLLGSCRISVFFWDALAGLCADGYRSGNFWGKCFSGMVLQCLEYDCKGEVCEHNICRNVCIYPLSKMVSVGESSGRYRIWKRLCICARGIIWRIVSEKSLYLDACNITFRMGCIGIFDIISILNSTEVSIEWMD